jgi:hypothetical protein
MIVGARQLECILQGGNIPTCCAASCLAAAATGLSVARGGASIASLE